MELSHRSIKVIEYVQYGQECMKHMNLMKRKMEDKKDIREPYGNSRDQKYNS